MEVGLNAFCIVLPRWDNNVMGPHGAPPGHILLTPGQPHMFRGSHVILSAKQAATTSLG